MLFGKFVKDYLSFGKRERIALLSVCIIAGLTILMPRLLLKPIPAFKIEKSSVLASAMDSIQQQKEVPMNENEPLTYQYEPSVSQEFKKGVLFRFDPNQLGLAEWRKLGLPEKPARTIINYRSKGGKFYKPEDLKKIWGLPIAFYEWVKDSIFITPGHKPVYANNYPVKKGTIYKRLLTININSADTSDWIALPGIGSKLASRIINFREKLGGFYSIEQVKETYGLPDSTYQKIVSFLQLGGPVKRININTATKDVLKMHPYIKWKIANAIVEYRNQHGAYKSVEDLKKLVVIEKEVIKKISPYLTIADE